MTGNADVVVVGGGHNGLVAAAYLARAGLTTVVCERRGVTGGAAVSEHPFGPDYTVTSLSYVVSLLPPDLVRDLRLEQHGYQVYPQGPYFAPRADGRYLRLPHDPAERHAEIARFSAADADAYPRYEAHLDGIGRLLGPLLHQIPPRLGSRRPQDLLRQARLLASLRGVDERGAVDVTRLLTGSIADLLEGYFSSDAMLGLLSVSGVIGTWAGPRSAGTAYVMLHHHIGETEGAAGAWGFPRGGMGGVSSALARAARMFGAQIRTDAEVEQIRTSGGRVAGVTLAGGESIDAPVVVTTAHPQISFLRLLDPAELPAGFVADIRGWRSRSGTVKINLALDRLPVFTSYPEPDPSVYGGTIVLAESLDDIETAFQQAVSGTPATLPFADICIPSVFDDSLAPAGKHIMSMFTQWVPSGYADAPHEEDLEAYADRVLARVERVAPGFTASVLHRQVIGPHQMQEEYGLVGGNIFHGELSLGQMFHARPAAGYADLRTPVRGLYQAGSATHGGGGVTGIPGRNVVRQVLADRRAERWRRRVGRPTGARKAPAAPDGGPAGRLSARRSRSGHMPLRGDAGMARSNPGGGGTRMGQGVRDLLALARCGRFAAGFPATISFAHRTLGDLNRAYNLAVTPAVAGAITDLAERARVNAALQAMSMKMGMAMLSYARLAGCEERFEVAALAGAVTRLYDDLIDGSADGSIDDRLGDLFSARPFTAASDPERLLAELVAGIRGRVEHIEASVIALGSLHEYQSLSRRQREPDVPHAVLEKICRGKGAMANLTLCSLVKPTMEAGERELIMALGEAFQSLDDYMDVHLDASHGVTTLASLGMTTLVDIGVRMRQLRPALVSRYGRAATRRYCGMIYFVLVKAAVDRRLPALGQLFRKLIRPSALKVFVIKGTDALPAAPGASARREADSCDD